MKIENKICFFFIATFIIFVKPDFIREICSNHEKRKMKRKIEIDSDKDEKIEKRISELTDHLEKISLEINGLRDDFEKTSLEINDLIEDKEFLLTAVNLEFGNENEEIFETFFLFYYFLFLIPTSFIFFEKLNSNRFEFNKIDNDNCSNLMESTELGIEKNEIILFCLYLILVVSESICGKTNLPTSKCQHCYLEKIYVIGLIVKRINNNALISIFVL